MLGLHHAGIVVSDLDRAIDFYTGVLGLTLIAEPSESVSGAGLDVLLKSRGARLRGAMLRAGANSLELLEFSAPARADDEPVASHLIGAQHAAFEVTDVHDARAQIEQRGGQFLGDVNIIDDGPFRGLRTTFLVDPDGIRIELVEVAYTDAPAREAGVADYWSRRSASAITPARNPGAAL